MFFRSQAIYCIAQNHINVVQVIELAIISNAGCCCYTTGTIYVVSLVHVPEVIMAHKLAVKCWAPFEV